jgi:hypothetical protein
MDVYSVYSPKYGNFRGVDPYSIFVGYIMKQLDSRGRWLCFRTPCQSASPASGHVERSTATMKPRLPRFWKGKQYGFHKGPNHDEGIFSWKVKKNSIFLEAPRVMIVLI